MPVNETRDPRSGYPTYGVAPSDPSDSNNLSSLAGVSFDTSGNLILIDKNGTTQVTVGTTGTTIVTSSVTNYNTMSVGDGTATTQTVFQIVDLASLTTGKGIKVASSATAIT